MRLPFRKPLRALAAIGRWRPFAFVTHRNAVRNGMDSPLAYKQSGRTNSSVLPLDRLVAIGRFLTPAIFACIRSPQADALANITASTVPLRSPPG